MWTAVAVRGLTAIRLLFLTRLLHAISWCCLASSRHRVNELRLMFGGMLDELDARMRQ
jgi:hypothetical protein